MHSAINSKLFKSLSHNTDQLFEIELVSPEVEYREPISHGFFNLQDGKQRILELYFKFFKKLCDADKYEDFEMDTGSLYLALSEEKLEDVFLPEKQEEWNSMRSRDFKGNLTSNATNNFSITMCSNTHKKHDKREPGRFKEAFICSEMFCLCSKT